jgi:hypothetical protein
MRSCRSGRAYTRPTCDSRVEDRATCSKRTGSITTHFEGRVMLAEDQKQIYMQLLTSKPREPVIDTMHELS